MIGPKKSGGTNYLVANGKIGVERNDCGTWLHKAGPPMMSAQAVQAADITAKNGEPGYFWLQTAREYGRMCDPPDYKDMLVEGANPCSEQSLESYELCCLVETFPARHGTFDHRSDSKAHP